MATTQWTDTAMQAALKIIFDDAMVNSVVAESELLDLFQADGGIQTDQTTGGRYIEGSKLFNLPAGVGARSEGDYIPEASGPKIVNDRIYLKKILGTVELSGDTMKRVRTSEGAFVDWADQALPALVRRLNNELDRMLLGYGAGIKARVNAGVPATNLVVDSPMGIDSLGLDVRSSLLHFLAGETLIASPNADGTTPRSGVMTVEAIDWDNGYLVVDALAASLADNDYLFPGDAAGNSAAKEVMGLFGIVDDGSVLTTLQNISRTTYPEWRSLVVDAIVDIGAGTKLTEDTILYVDDRAYVQGAAVIDTLIASRKGLRDYWADLKADRTINDPRSYTGGKMGVSILLGDREVMLRAPRKMPDDTCFGVTRNRLRRWTLHNWEWQDQTGSIWKQVTDGTGRKDAHYAYGAMYAEVGTDDPQKHWRIENLAA